MEGAKTCVEPDAVKDAAEKALLSNDGEGAAPQQLQLAEPDDGSGKSCACIQLQQHWPLLVLLWLTHVCIGMASALPGSSLVQLTSQVGASLSTMGFWFTVKSVASCVPALLTGFLFVRLPGAAKAAFLAACNAVCAGALLSASLARSCALVLCLAGLLGAGHGALETANGILTIRVFGSLHSRPILHSLHLCTALGGLVAPLLLSSFTAAGSSNATAAAASAAAAASGNGSTPWEAGSGICGGGDRNESALLETAAAASAPQEAQLPLVLIGPYSVLFALQTAVSVGLLVLAIRRYRLTPLTDVLLPPLPESPAAAAATDIGLSAQPMLTAGRRRLLIALTVVFYFAAVGGENIFWSFVSAYGICSPALRLDERGAANLHAAFFAGFLAGRCLGVAVSHWARPAVIMLAHLTGCVLALVALCLAAAPWLTFAGTAAFGLCVSVLYATGVTWLEQRMRVAGPVACSWSIGGQLGIAALPALAGHLLVSPATGPAAVMYIALGALSTAAAVFLLMLLLTGRLQRQRPKYP